MHDAPARKIIWNGCTRLTTSGKPANEPCLRTTAANSISKWAQARFVRNRQAAGAALIHPGCGHLLRETAVRARKAQSGELSPVGLWNGLQKSQDRLHAFCIELLQERGVESAAVKADRGRAINATAAEH